MKKSGIILIILFSLFSLVFGAWLLKPFWGSGITGFVTKQVVKYISPKKNSKPVNTYIGEPPVQIVVPEEAHLQSVPKTWNGVYTGKLNGSSEKIVVANGSITYSSGKVYKNIPYMITIPEYYLYLGNHPVITQNKVTVNTSKGEQVFSYTNGQIVITQNGKEIGRFTRQSGAGNDSPIPSKWSGVYTGVVAFMDIRAWAAGGSFTFGMGTYNGKRVIVTLPEQAYFTGYPFSVSDSSMTAYFPPFKMDMELKISSNTVGVWGNGKKFGTVKKK
ncbi:MAG: hypothetical protein A2Y33_03205 [Spirochaetes bacterium GWF1_51_8]|nr:MAG: hypothetical protein A2Y33_03205 [Spirochaetes bacterium GWF1_51_8]